MKLAPDQSGVHQILGNAVAWQTWPVDPGSTQVDHLQTVQIPIAAPELLDRRLADAIGQHRIERMRLVDPVGPEHSVRFLRAQVDTASDARKPHGLEDIERPLDVHTDHVDRAAERREYADDRRAMHDGVRLVNHRCVRDVGQVGDVAGHANQAFVRGICQAAKLRVEGDGSITTRQQRASDRRPEEAAATSDQNAHGYKLNTTRRCSVISSMA